MSMNKSIESKKLRNFENVIRGMTIYRQIENDSEVTDKSPRAANFNIAQNMSKSSEFFGMT